MSAGQPDQVDVRTLATVEYVDPGLAVEDIDPGIAPQRVGESIAGPAEVAAAGERQILDEVAEGPVDAALDRVITAGVVRAGAGRGFVDLVTEVVDDVAIVTGTAQQDVGTQAAVQAIGAGVAGQRVVQRIASGSQVAAAQQRQILQVGAQPPTDSALDGVDLARQA